MRGRGSPAWIALVSMLPSLSFIVEVSTLYSGVVQYSNIDPGMGLRVVPVSHRISLLSSPVTMRPYHSSRIGNPSRRGISKMPRLPTTRIGVKRIVIEVNRDLTVEQLEILDDALKRAGLVKETKVTFHNHEPHKPRMPRAAHQHPTWRIGRESQSG